MNKMQIKLNIRAGLLIKPAFCFKIIKGLK